MLAECVDNDVGRADGSPATLGLGRLDLNLFSHHARCRLAGGHVEARSETFGLGHSPQIVEQIVPSPTTKGQSRLIDHAAFCSSFTRGPITRVPSGQETPSPSGHRDA